ncbi:MAG: 3-methyl-2-oxobutanoate dehydrogenase subunit beta, partial [Frondihabitans sp.]|nr:3-methyl-2-oxobutanoate dehydrogenase subunit beta [Frondihabitans sp.]
MTDTVHDLPEAALQPTTEILPLGRAINAGLRQALRDDPRVLLLGEDIGTLGGVFRVTEGLQSEFGAKRVIDTPLAESGIVGSAIGLAMRGFRPVVEIQFDGFI